MEVVFAYTMLMPLLVAAEAVNVAFSAIAEEEARALC